MLLRIAGIFVVILVAVTAFLIFMRGRLDRHMTRRWVELRPPAGEAGFHPDMVAELPEAAQRYFRHAIQPGTRLARSVYLEMEGRFGLQPGAEKVPMRAQEILAAPHGLIWKASIGSGFMRFSGYDYYVEGEGAMRWFLWGVIPLVRADAPEITRSAAGRVGMEALAWLPSVLLPQNGIGWESVDEHSARARIQVGSEELAPTIKVAPDGRLERIEMMRWDPDDGRYVLYVGEVLGEERDFAGYTIPTKISLTSKVGTPEENTFFEAFVITAEFT
jgi:hypothetical protein